MLAFLLALTIWQGIERSQKQTDTLGFIDVLESARAEKDELSGAEQSDFHSGSGGIGFYDPFGVEQEGVALMQVSEGGDIYWYQSSWSSEQSRVLLERALIFSGWESLSKEEEEIMSFVYAQTATANGNSLIATFYDLDQGCSILLELM